MLDSGQGGKGHPGLLLTNGSEVKVDEGGLERGVAEVGGELMELGAAFEHVGGVGVTQSVGRDFLVVFAQAAFGGGDFDGTPDAGFGHGVTAVVKGLPDGDAGRFPPPPDSGKEPVFVAMVFPEGTKSIDERGGDGDFARLATFAVADVEDEAFAVDVFGVKGEGFAEAQSSLVDEGEVGAVTTVAKGAQEADHFFASEDVGKRFFTFDFNFGPDLPFEAEVVAVEGAQGADGLVDGAA